MATLTRQPIVNVLDANYTAPGLLDTFAWEPGLLLHCKIGATSTTVTVAIPGNDDFTGVAIADWVPISAVTNDERFLAIPEKAKDANGMVVVSWSQVANCTMALLRTPKH